MNCAEAYVKFMCDWLLDHCFDDMEFMAKNYDKSCINRLRMVASTPFERITYTEAVELLEVAVKEGKHFENKVEWGIDLASEHERYADCSCACNCFIIKVWDGGVLIPWFACLLLQILN